jgi:translocating chain-associated membrane protein 1
VFILLTQKVKTKLHLSKVKQSKFNESGQLLLFYVVAVLWGGDVIFREGLLFNVSALWRDYPNIAMTFMFKFFFIVQMAYWLHCYPELYFQKVKREDMPARITYATIYLVTIAAAYVMNFTRLALCLLVLHYAAETVFHVARLIHFADKPSVAIKGIFSLKFYMIYQHVSYLFLVFFFSILRLEHFVCRHSPCFHHPVRFDLLVRFGRQRVCELRRPSIRIGRRCRPPGLHAATLPDLPLESTP